jgi:hypothetical protein
MFNIYCSLIHFIFICNRGAKTRRILRESESFYKKEVYIKGKR